MQSIDRAFQQERNRIKNEFALASSRKRKHVDSHSHYHVGDEVSQQEAGHNQTMFLRTTSAPMKCPLCSCGCRCAMAAPMPRKPPVTRARPANSLDRSSINLCISSFFCLVGR